jgi:hypothetical protein
MKAQKRRLKPPMWGSDVTGSAIMFRMKCML